tara:strand:+ start:217 stop:720 length:504 start_codon:yes stop_codon:yes gene_type:complete
MSNWSTNRQNALNKQINLEYDAFYKYTSLAQYFNRNSVGLDKLVKYYKKCANEEKEHAEKFMDYQCMRNGIVEFTDIKCLNLGSSSNDVYDAFNMALQMEKAIYDNLLKLHELADKENDPQFCDFLESNFLDEQVEAISKLTKILSVLKRIGNDGHGIWHYVEELEI